MSATNAPVVLFAYMRPEHLRETLAALKRNPESSNTELYVYCDAAKLPAHQAKVDEVRLLVDAIEGFSAVHRTYRTVNMGLARSIIDGVTHVLNRHDCVIVLEDDLVTSAHFLAYMNEALACFANDDRVISIHGYVYPVQQTLPEAFFLPGADCWGWATWRRGWRLFNPDGQRLFEELKRRDLLKSFDFNGAYGYSKMLQRQIKGTNDSWAVRWHASAFLAGKLTLYPGRSLVHNIGNDSSGTHCDSNTGYDANLSAAPIDLSAVEVMPSEAGRTAFEAFFRANQGSPLMRFLSRVRNKLSKVLA